MKLWKILARNSHVYNHPLTEGTDLELRHLKCRSPTFSSDSGKDSNGSFQGNHLITVRLKKLPEETLGINLSTSCKGNSEFDHCPSIASLRPDSVAWNSDQLAPGDRLHSVNGIKTSRMRNEDVNTLLDHVDGNALLEIEYSLPSYASQNSLCVTSKVTEITIERVDGSLGITLRGGQVPDHPHLSRPLVITQVRPNGPAYRTGLIRIGDRVLKVDSHPLTNKTLLEAQRLLRCDRPDQQQAHTLYPTSTTLTLEYDVSIMESVKYATGPLLVEIDRHVNEDLGLVLGNCPDFAGLDDILPAGAIYIENIISASTADRCGALNIGDQLLAVDNVQLVNTDDWWSAASTNHTTSIEEAERLLRDATRLQILPYQAVAGSSSGSTSVLRTAGVVGGAMSGGRTSSGSGASGGCARNYASLYASDNCGFSTVNSRRSRTGVGGSRGRQHRHSVMGKHQDTDNAQSSHCNYAQNIGVCHPETLSITLVAERGKGYGFTVSVKEHENKPSDVIINRIITDSPAYRCGCLQAGDRILSINRQTNLTIQEISAIIEMGIEPAPSGGKLLVQVEFDVADTVVPSSGVFIVKLARRMQGLGITITASKTQPEEPFLITDIRRGSTAHRTGTLQPGDRLLAVDNRPLNHLTVDAAFDLLQQQQSNSSINVSGGTSSDIVTLRVEKVCNSSEERRPRSMSTASGTRDVVPGGNVGGSGAMGVFVTVVELVKNGGPLGVTIAGSEECTEPIVLSRLTEGGLAEKIGSLHIGDIILAINGENLENRPLSEAIRLLQSSGDRVQLKIARNIKPTDDPLEEGLRCNYSSPGLTSIDSAVHSWDSNTADNVNDILEPEVKDTESVLSEPLSSCYPDSNYPDPAHFPLLPKPPQLTNNHPRSPTSGQLQYYSDAEELLTEDDFCPSPLPLPNYSFTNTLNKYEPYTLSNISGNGNNRANINSGNSSSNKYNQYYPCNSANSQYSNNNNTSQYNNSGQFNNVSSSHNQFNSQPYSNQQYSNISHQVPRSVSTASSSSYMPSVSDIRPAMATLAIGGHHQYLTGVTDSVGSVALLQQDCDVYHVTLYKDSVYDDYGFSVSDGLYEKGVYVNRIRQGGPADIVGLLRPYDRIIQVNETKTQEFDCCLTVPLIASAGDRIELVIARNPYGHYSSDKILHDMSNRNFSSSQNTITKTL